MDSTSKNWEAAADFDLDLMTLKDNDIVEVDMEEPKKAKGASGEPKTVEATGES